MKTGQVTIFVIIGLVILGVSLGLFYFLSSDAVADIEIFRTFLVSENVQELESLLSSCIERESKEALVLLGLQAGYINLPEDYFFEEFYDIPYNYDKGVKTLPSIETISRDTGRYIDRQLDSCLYEMKTSYDKFEFTPSNPVTTIIIEQERILIETKYPVKVNIEDDTYNMRKKYEFDIPLNFGRIYDLVDVIIDKEIEEPEFVALSTLMSSDFEVEVTPYDDGAYAVYSITDDAYLFDEEPYVYLFANRF